MQRLFFARNLTAIIRAEKENEARPDVKANLAQDRPCLTEDFLEARTTI